MYPVKVERETNIFKKPPDWDDEKNGVCMGLSVRKEQICGLHHHFSNWRPDAEELAILNAGGVIEICCVNVQPPLAVSAIAGVDDDDQDRRTRSKSP